VKGVVIRLRDRIEFVVVTSRARNRQPEERLGGDINAVVDDVIGVAVEMVAERDEAERSLRVFVSAKGQLVRRELFDNESVIRLVFVESLDDVIAISPRIRINGTFAPSIELPFGIRVPRHIEPVPSPTFTVMRRGQQLVHHLFKCLRRIIVQELVRFLRRRWQTNQVEIDAANQRARVRCQRVSH